MASTDKQVRVAVVGAGAVGSYFGGMLARSGVPVTLIARAANVEAIRANKLFIDAVTFQERVAVNASTEISAARDADVVLFCVKMTDTEEAARSLAPYLAPNAIVVSLQNGVDNVPRIRAASGIDALAAVVYIAAAMPEPGHVKHSGAGSLAVGEQVDRKLADGEQVDREPAEREQVDRNSPAKSSAPPPAGRAERIAALFTAAGVPCRVSPDIEADMWSKFVMNCAGNAVTGITQISYTQFGTQRDNTRHLQAGDRGDGRCSARGRREAARSGLRIGGFEISPGRRRWRHFFHRAGSRARKAHGDRFAERLRSSPRQRTRHRHSRESRALRIGKTSGRKSCGPRARLL